MTAAMALEASAAPTDRYADLDRAELEERLARYEVVFRQVSEVAGAAARGDLEPRCLAAVEGDAELATLQENINHLLDMTDAFVREAGAALSSAAQGKFFRRLLPHGLLGAFRRAAHLVNAAADTMRHDAQALAQAGADRVRLASAFEESVMGLVAQVASAATILRGNSDELARIAESTTGDSRVLWEATDASSERLNVIAAATEELTATVGEITRQTTQSSHVAADAVRQATRTYQQVEHLEGAAHKVQYVAQLIAEVAGQTRLLALNATIEAARAGEAGRGFAVVASEVKGLASQTAAATTEIQNQIDAIQSATHDAVGAVRGIEVTIGKMAEVTTAVDRSLSEQRIASLEISGSVTASAEQMREMSRAVHSVAQSTGRTADAAAGLQSASGALAALAESLRENVAVFVARIRG
jgi:methyl-accepting chemotaxis protein